MKMNAESKLICEREDRLEGCCICKWLQENHEQWCHFQLQLAEEQIISLNILISLLANEKEVLWFWNDSLPNEKLLSLQFQTDFV